MPGYALDTKFVSFLGMVIQYSSPLLSFSVVTGFLAGETVMYII